MAGSGSLSGVVAMGGERGVAVPEEEAGVLGELRPEESGVEGVVVVVEGEA